MFPPAIYKDSKYRNLSSCFKFSRKVSLFEIYCLYESDLLIKLFNENGRHARTATGVTQLPFGASVQLDIIFLIKP